MQRAAAGDVVAADAKAGAILDHCEGLKKFCVGHTGRSIRVFI
jgi:hypothetical protein